MSSSSRPPLQSTASGKVPRVGQPKTSVTVMTREMAKKLAEQTDSDTKVTVYEYTDDSSSDDSDDGDNIDNDMNNEDEPKVDEAAECGKGQGGAQKTGAPDATANVGSKAHRASSSSSRARKVGVEQLSVKELQPLLQKLQQTAARIRTEHPEWRSDDDMLTELKRREPDITMRIGASYAMMLKFIASCFWIAEHEKILGYMLYIRSMVEQKQIDSQQANYVIAHQLQALVVTIDEEKKKWLKRAP